VKVSRKLNASLQQRPRNRQI